MTQFEELAMEIIGKIEVGEDGFYRGHTSVLATITNDIILSDDEKIFNLPWEQQKEMIKKEFLRIYPYFA